MPGGWARGGAAVSEIPGIRERVAVRIRRAGAGEVDALSCEAGVGSMGVRGRSAVPNVEHYGHGIDSPQIGDKIQPPIVVKICRRDEPRSTSGRTLNSHT